MGTSNSTEPSRRIASTSIRPNRMNGRHLPVSSVAGWIGVTMICSSVPVSRSRASPIAVTIALTLSSSDARMPGTM